jgi:aryl-alcohol dehydrogenase-like predicted oxidoreductase
VADDEPGTIISNARKTGAQSVQLRRLGKTGLQVAPLGFGGAPVGFLGTGQAQVAELLSYYLDTGGNVIDTAASYEGSEEAIGRAIGNRRDEFILISKCGRDLPRLKGAAWTAELIQETLEQSLKRLRTDHLDVALLHSCSLAELSKGHAMEALVQARDAGKVRFVGYSGDNEAAVHAAEMQEVSVIETSVNLCDQRNAEIVAGAAKEANVGLIAKRPIANSPWKNLHDQPGMYAEYAAEYTQRFAKMGLTLDSLEIDGSPAAAWPGIALRFTVFHCDIHTAVVGTTKKQHLAENLKAIEQGALDAVVVERIREAYERAQKRGGAPWPGQT